MNKKLKIYCALIISMIFWALSYIWFKEANKTFQPMTIVFIRIFFSAIMMTIFMFLSGNYMKIRRKDFKILFMLAFFEPFLYFIGESFGLTYVSATLCSVIISTIPVFASIGALLIFKERLKNINYTGIFISFIGIAVFILNKDGTLSFSLKGLGLLLFAVFAAVGYNLTLGHLVKTYSPVFIVTVQNIIGATLFFPLFLITDFRQFSTIHLTPLMFKPIIELAVFASCGAFILFAWSVRKMGISRTNVFSNCIPLFTAFFSFIFMGDKLSLQNIIGMVIVVSGIFMSQINGMKTEEEEAIALTGKTA